MKEVPEAQTRARGPGAPAPELGTGCRLCSGWGGAVRRGDAFGLNLKVQDTDSVLSPVESTHFPLRSNLRATALRLRPSSQWMLMFWPGRAALAKRYGLEGSFTGVENRVNSIKARGPGL